jgi:hypothetical protein
MASHFYKRLLAGPEAELHNRKAFEGLLGRSRRGVST